MIPARFASPSATRRSLPCASCSGSTRSYVSWSGWTSTCAPAAGAGVGAAGGRALGLGGGLAGRGNAGRLIRCRSRARWSRRLGDGRRGGSGWWRGRGGRRGNLLGGLCALLELGRRQDRVRPLLELLLLVDELDDVVLGVLELRAPEQRVERAHLDADPAVHAERVVDREAVEHLDRTRLAARRRIVRLFVRLDVDAPVGALARALPADGAVRFLERDHAARSRRKV